MSLIRTLQTQLRKRERSAVEITQDYLDRIALVEPQVHSFLCLMPERALAQAARIDQALAQGQALGPLAGIPIALKDNLCTTNVPTTCASKILYNYQAPYEATVNLRLEAAGGILMGKTNLDEFAMGSSTENSAYGPTRNPWNLATVPGGSSGGSAAAVAAQSVVAALGSDTGGSIRQPAAFCGVVGMKPTYGLVSRYGLVAFASSLDQIGPFAGTVEDSALMLQAIAGHDPMDSTSLNLTPPDYSSALIPDVKGLKVGLVKEFIGEGTAPEVLQAIEAALEVLKSLGAEIQEVSCPQFKYGLPTYYIIAPCEASANLARYDGVKYGLRVENPSSLLNMYAQSRDQGFGREVKRRIMIGTYALSSGYYDAYYIKALKVRTLIKQDFLNALGQVDVLVGPTAPTTAFKFGDKEDPLSMYLSDVCTIPLNLAGLPGISIPCGFDSNQLPIGLQIMGGPLQESTLLRVAYAYEQATAWHTQHPKLN